MDFEGVEPKFHRLYVNVDEPSANKRVTVARYTTSVRCPGCGGTRLAEAPRTATVDGRTLPALTAWTCAPCTPSCAGCAPPRSPRSSTRRWPGSAR